MDRAGFPVVDGVRRYKDGKTPLQLTIDMSPGAAGDPVILSRMQQDYSRNLQIDVTLDTSPGFVSNDPTTARVTTGAFDISVVSDQGDPDPVYNEQDILGPTDAQDIPSAKNPFGSDWLGIVDPVVMQQIQLGGETTDAGQRASIYRDLQRHVAQQFYIEPVYIQASVSLVKPTLCNFKAWPHAGVNFWNMSDWYVAPSCPT
jgi:ABC-type oligopeptide transport system substrate-binding subunit